MLRALGKLTATAGTLKRFTSGFATPSEKVGVHGLLAQALSSNTGKVYIGTAGMNKSTGVEVIAILAIPTTNAIPSFTAALTISPNGLNLADLWFDVDNTGEGILLSYLQA